MSQVRSWHLILLSFGIHLGLLFYADHVDSHPERYGGLKYTDVDWRVVMDGARLIFSPASKDQLAQGWLARVMQDKGWSIGDPYPRQTFRYTPLLPLLVSPSLYHPILGKILLSIISLSIPVLLRLNVSDRRAPASTLHSPPAPFWATHLVWTLNPFVLNITTRGSPEAVIVFLVVLTLALLRLSDAWMPPASPKNASGVRCGSQRYADASAAIFALAISYKIYPVIYVPAIWHFLRRQHGLLGMGIWRFGIVTAATLAAVNGALWSIWGQSFLEHTFLYHLHRKDHRHNFSLYFYPIYLSSFAPETAIAAGSEIGNRLLSLFRHPLASFLPQATLILGAGWALVPVAGLPFAMFVQTVAFVIFNKVCTSQYFMWFLALIPPIIPQLCLSGREAATLVGVWILGQAAWLGMAYRLELLAQDAFLAVWLAGLALFGGSVWALGRIIDSVKPATPMIRRA